MYSAVTSVIVGKSRPRSSITRAASTLVRMILRSDSDASDRHLSKFWMTAMRTFPPFAAPASFSGSSTGRPEGTAGLFGSHLHRRTDKGIEDALATLICFRLMGLKPDETTGVTGLGATDERALGVADRFGGANVELCAPFRRVVFTSNNCQIETAYF